MKIEMGESIVYSWLKHCKGCGIVQLNWKPSPSSVEDSDKRVQALMSKAQKMFGDFSNLFKKNKASQLVKQCEIDVLGYDFKHETLYACEVAFHESGLSYGSVRETVRRVIAKMIRSAMALQAVFPGVSAQINFMTPKAGNPCGELLQKNLKKLNELATKSRLEYKFSLITNEDFRTKIFEPVCEVSLNVADTSELFMRSLKLAKMFEEYGLVKNSSEPEDSSTGRFRIGKLVKSTFIKLFEQNRLAKMLKSLQNKKYSSDNFHIQFSAIKNINDPDFLNLKNRYWAVRLGGRYVVCSQWYERHRSFFTNWVKHNFSDFHLPGE